MKDNQREVKLKVGDLSADRMDYGRGIARLSTRFMKELGIKEGDYIEIEGKRKTVAIAVRAYPSDVGLDIIRIDGLTRRNAGAGVGEVVKVRPAEVKEARKMVIAPAQKGITIHTNPEYLKQNLYRRAFAKGDIFIPNPVYTRRRSNSFLEEFFGMSLEDIFFAPFGDTKFIVVNTNPKGYVWVGEATEIELLPQAVEVKEEEKIPEVTYEHIGGLKNEIKLIREMVELPLRHPEVFQRLGIKPPKGVLLYGPPGTGKTLLAKAVANESGANFYSINGPEIMSMWYGKSEENLRQIFEEAEKNAPAIIFIDEIDAIAPKREEVHGEVEKRIVSQLLCLHPSTLVYSEKGQIPIQKLFEEVKGKTIEDEFGVIHKLPEEEVYVLGMDEEGKVNRVKVIALSKTKIKNPIRIKLANGGELIASKITKLLKIGNGEIEWVSIDQLKEGDWVIIPNNLPLPSEICKLELSKLPEKDKWIAKLEEKSIPSLVFDRRYVKLSELDEFEKGEMDLKKLRKLRQKIVYLLSKNPRISKEKLENLLGVSRKALNNALRRLEKKGIVKIEKNMVELSIAKSYDILGIAYKVDGKIYPIKDKYFIKLPLYLEEKLAKLLGYIISKGHLYPCYLNLSGSVTKEASSIIENLFHLKPKKEKTHVEMLYAYSKPLVKFLNSYFGIPFGKKSKKVKVPSQLYLSPESVRAAFLAGLLEGDGHVGDSRIRFFTSSKELAKGIATLLYSLGIPAKIKKYNLYVIQPFGGYETFERFYQTVGAFVSDKKQKSKLEKLLIRKKAISSIIWPIKERLYELRQSCGIRIDDNKYRYLSPNVNLHINSNVLGYFIKSLEGLENVWVRELRKLAKANVIPMKIEQIERINKEMEMYDLTTETSNFIVGELPIIVHNTLMDGLKGRGEVIVIGATNRPDALDPALRRPGRFDRELEIGVPDKDARLEILQIHSRNMPLAKDVDLKEIAERTYGYVGADLEAVCKEAAMAALRRVLPDIMALKEGEEIPKEILEKLVVTKEDFEHALGRVEPSAMREVLVEVPNVKWDDIGGLEEVKQQLKEVVEWPLKYPDVFERMGIKPPKGVLLYGPPGTGKTLLAKAVANESGANFISIKGPELLSKWLGESERRLRETFKRAKQVAPCIIFFDEIDAITSTRGIKSTETLNTLVSQLLTEMSGIEEVEGVVVLAATNRPDLIDLSLLRPGRFDRQIYVPTPDEKARLEILRVHTKKMPLAKDVRLEEIAKITQGYSGADLEALCREAAMIALREDLKSKEVKKEHFDKALKTIKPSIPKEVSEWYERFTKKLKMMDVEEEKEKKSEVEYAK